MKKAILALTMLSASVFSAEHHFSNVQLDNLQYAYQFGEQFTKDGKYFLVQTQPIFCSCTKERSH